MKLKINQMKNYTDVLEKGRRKKDFSLLPVFVEVYV
jgi:hypothetical protein